MQMKFDFYDYYMSAFLIFGISMVEKTLVGIHLSVLTFGATR